MILFSPSRDHNLLSVSGSFLVNSHHDSVFFQRSYWTSESNFHARNAVWHSSDWLNAQTWVASSSSKPPHISADTTTVTLRVAQHGAHSALIAEWRRNDAVFLSVAWVPNLIRAQFSAGAHSWACSCMQLLTGLERARVTGCGEKKSKPKKFLVLGWFFREKKKFKETKKEKCFGYRYLQNPSSNDDKDLVYPQWSQRSPCGIDLPVLQAISKDLQGSFNGMQFFFLWKS